MSEPPISPSNPWIPPRERAPPAMDHAAGFKESAYTPEMGALILARIGEGETVKQVTADPRMPSYATVYRWTHVIPEFGEAWRALRRRLCADRIWVDQQRAVAKVWMRAHARRLAGKPARDRVSGARSSYTPERAQAVCEAIEGGASLSEVVARPGMPSFKAVYGWMRRFPTFRLAYVEACCCREFLLHETAIDVAQSSNPMSYAAAKRQVAALHGKAGRTAPKKYRALPPEDAAWRLAGR
jgi:transposase-like protein